MYDCFLVSFWVKQTLFMLWSRYEASIVWAIFKDFLMWAQISATHERQAKKWAVKRTWAEGSGERLELQCFFLFRRLLIFRHHLSGDGKPFSVRETRRCNCMQLHFGDTFLERSRLTSSTLKPRMKNWLKLSDKKELQHYANWQSFSLPSSAAFRVWTRVGRVGVIVDIHTAKTRHWS